MAAVHPAREHGFSLTTKVQEAPPGTGITFAKPPVGVLPPVTADQAFAETAAGARGVGAPSAMRPTVGLAEYVNANDHQAARLVWKVSYPVDALTGEGLGYYQTADPG